VPVLSAEVFIIPAEAGQYIVYAPLRRAAFVANAKMVNFLADLQAGVWDAAAGGCRWGAWGRGRAVQQSICFFSMLQSIPYA
jgi:hypothetical protein